MGLFLSCSEGVSEGVIPYHGYFISVCCEDSLKMSLGLNQYIINHSVTPKDLLLRVHLCMQKQRG